MLFHRLPHIPIVNQETDLDCKPSEDSLSGGATLALILTGLWWLAARPNGSNLPATESAARSESGVLAVDARRATQMGIRIAPATAAEEAPLEVIPEAAPVEAPAQA